MLGLDFMIQKKATFAAAVVAGGLLFLTPVLSTAQDGHDHGSDAKKSDQSGMMDHSMHKSGDQHGSEMKAGAMHHKTAGGHTVPEASIRHGHAFVLATCPVDGAPLADADNPIAIKLEGQPIRFDSEACKQKFEANPAAYLKKIEEQVVAAQKDAYPLDKCVVSGQKLGAMGDPVDYVHNGTRLVRFCCNGCFGQFKKDPDKFLEKIDAAVIASQIDDYPLDHCVVMADSKLVDEEAINYVYGAQLVRFCCKGCVQDFEKSPQKFLNKIDAAAKGHTDEAKKPMQGQSMPMNHDQHSDQNH